MKRHVLFSGLSFLLAAFLAFPIVLSAQPELSQGMSQGDFALWLVKAIGASQKLPPAANADDAIEFLTKLGVIPEGGWDKDTAVTNEFLVELTGEDSTGGSFEELVDRVRDHVQGVYDEKVLGVFRAQSSGTPSAPA